ncbi:nucleotidyltransferase family protein [bacterium]|nr:nucleotidyltransferase family protein [bacterium]
MIPELPLDRSLLWRALQGDARAWGQWRALERPMDTFCRRLLPEAYVRLRSQAPQGIEQLHRAYSQALLDFRTLTQATLPLLQIWRNEGVDVAILKGAALNLYGLLRCMADVDILVPADQFQHALRIARKAGFKPDFAARAEPGASHAVALSSARRHQLDLHWTLLFDARWTGLDGPLWGRTSSVEFGGVWVSVLAPEDLLLQVCAHAFLGSDPHAWMLDADYLLSEFRMDWGVIWLEAEKRRVVPALVSTLQFLSRHGVQLEAPDFSHRRGRWPDHQYFASRARGDRCSCWILNFLRHAQSGGFVQMLRGHTRLALYRLAELFTRRPGSVFQDDRT